MPASPPLAIGHAAIRAGSRLGAWELREPIGHGGMGEVWSATRVDGLHQGRAAVKVLRATGDGTARDLLNARFAREGELLARLAHPHIAQLLDAGFTPDGGRYLVLEYVKGERIDRWCDQRRYDLAARLRLVLQLCEAVAYAHANLVVHRDLKPANILVTEGGHVKLLDFGVAKLLEDEPAGDELTRLGAAGLTPEYAAPEQFRGLPVSVATDVYALGVVTYLLLCGRRPHDAAGSDTARLIRAIVEGEPRKLSLFDDPAPPTGAAPSIDVAAIATARDTTPARLRQQLRGDLEHITAKAMRKRPAERYASAQAYADDLSRFLRHESVSARAPTWRYRSAKFVRRNRVGVAGASLVALAIAGGIGATLWQADIARVQAARARAEADNATAIKDFLLGVFDFASVGDGRTREDTTARELLQRGGERLLADHALAAPVRLELLTVIGSLQQNLGLVDAADPLQRQALEVAREVYGPTSEKYVYALVERCLALTQLGRPAEADALARQAIAIIEAHGQQAGESYPVALYQLGFSAVQAGDIDAGIGYLKRSIAAFTATQPRHAMHAIAHRWLGNALAARDDLAGAEAEFRRSIELSGEQDKLRDYGIGIGHYSLGELYVRAGRFADAKAELEEAQATLERTLGPRHRVLALVRGQLARALYQLGDPAAARTLLASAEDVARDDRSRQIGNAADWVNVALAQLALDDGRADEALARSRVAVERWRGGSAVARARLVALRAEAEALSGAQGPAIADLRSALAEFDRQLGAGSLGALEAQVLLGETLARGGPDARAADEGRLAFAAALAASGAASPTRDWLRARALLGQARLALPHDPRQAAQLAAAAGALSGGDAMRERELRRAAEALATQARAGRP